MLVKSEDRKMSEAIHTVSFSLEQDVASVSQSGYFILYLLSKHASVSHGLAAQDLTWIFALLTPCTFLISAPMSFLGEPSSHPVWGFLPLALPPRSLLFILFYFLHSTYRCLKLFYFLIGLFTVSLSYVWDVSSMEQKPTVSLCSTVVFWST